MITTVIISLLSYTPNGNTIFHDDAIILHRGSKSSRCYDGINDRALACYHDAALSCPTLFV